MLRNYLTAPRQIHLEHIRGRCSGDSHRRKSLSLAETYWKLLTKVLNDVFVLELFEEFDLPLER